MNEPTISHSSYAQAIASTPSARPHLWLACPHSLTLGTRASMADLSVIICATKPGFVMFAPVEEPLTNDTSNHAK